MRNRIGMLFIVGLLGASLGCSSDDNNASTTTTAAPTTSTTVAVASGAVGVVVKEFAIGLTPAVAKAGEVEFSIKNEGKLEHEFVIFKTQLAPDKLPTKAPTSTAASSSGAQAAVGDVDEDGAGVEHITEQEGVEPAKSVTFKATLPAGNYVVICNLPGHYAAGMHATLTVV